ncbi:MAG TPA: hypothetical protein VJ385_02730 [Fibrobacteria bacterium]|nr:hypothetical protein [Fibrobacteria bacterium]
MLERVSVSGIPLLAACCWFSAFPAEGRYAGLPDRPADRASAQASAPSPEPLSLPPSVRDSALRPIYPGAPLLITVPLFDLPYGFRGGLESPSMRQTLYWNAGATQWADQTIGWLWEGVPPGGWRVLGTYASLGLFNYLFVYLPLGGAWMHEEWHRAVMTRYRIPSYDGVYHWDIGTEAIPVDHVADRDLADLKARHPADFTRLMEAGIEGETESVRLMRRNNFFLGRRSDLDAINWWATSLNAAAYLYICSVEDFDADLEKANRRETAESRRDFAGLDFRAWVYDMRRPDEPYAAGPRGRTHPAGAGFDRYLLYSDLTRDERAYLRLQAGLSLLNLVSPQSIGRDWLPGSSPWDGRGLLWNFGLVHHLTPFGYDLGGDVLVRRGRWSWVFSARGLVNGEMILPGLGGELFRYPWAAGRQELFLTCAASAWLQPQDQLYRTTSVLPGGAVSLGAALPLRPSLELFLEADAKTPGWVPGNVYLDAAAQARAGLQIRL